MIDLAIGANGDLKFSNDLELVEDIDEVEQELNILLQTHKGEFFDDLDMGLDTSLIFVKQPNLSAISNSILNTLLNEDKVFSAEILQTEIRDRTLVVRFSATLKDGQTINSEVNLSD